MSTRIHKSILNLGKHIKLLPDNTLAKKVLDEQVNNNWDGLVSEAKEVAKKMNIIGLMDGNIGKKAFKNIVKKKARQFNDDVIQNQMSHYKKLDMLRAENNVDNKYLKTEPIHSARLIFRHKSEMFYSKMNYKNKYKGNLMCDSCQTVQDENTHVLFVIFIVI